MTISASLDSSSSLGRLLNAARTSPLLRQAGQMITTRGVGLIVAAAGSIWAARCLGPEKLGISGMILAILAPVGLLVDLNQDVSLVRRYKECPDDAARAQLVQETFIFRGLLCLCWMALAAGLIAFTGLPGADWHLGVVAAFPLLLVTVNQGAWVLQAQQNLPARYKALMLQSIIGASCYFLFFRPGRVAAGTDVIVMAIAVGAEFSLGWWFARRPLRSAIRPPHRSLAERGRSLLHGLRTAGQAYWVGRWLAITGIVSYLYIYLQTPLIGALLGTASLGQYRTATALLNGFQAFAAMIPALLYPKMIEWHRTSPDHLWYHQWRIMRLATCLFIPGAALAFYFAPHVYHLLYGPAFLSAAYPFAMLLISRMLMVLNGIFGWGLWAQHRDRLVLLITLATAIISLSLNFTLIPRMGLLGAATVCVISESLMLLGTIVASRMLLHRASAVAVTAPEI
jgi:O-antigen/teichoic acid export membrane protein